MQSTLQTPIPNALGYIRVSSREQAENSSALDNQRARVRALLPEGAPIFEDISSGTKSNRPGFQALLRAIKEGNYTHVVFTRPDRLGRNSRTGFQQIVDWWIGKEGKSIRPVSIDVPIDLDKVGGRFNLALLSEAAIFEVDMLSSRIRRTFELQMESKTRHCQPPFGYLCIDGNFVPDTEPRHCPLGLKPRRKNITYPGISNAELYQLWIKAYCKHHTLQGATREMEPYALTACTTAGGERIKNSAIWDNLTEPRTIFNGHPNFPPGQSGSRSFLYHPSYRGHRAYRRNWEEGRRPANGEKRNDSVLMGSNDTYQFFYKDIHEPLMSKAEWEKILVVENKNKAFDGSKGRGGVSLSKYPLTGILRCSSCGNGLRCIGKTTKSGSPQYYRCKTKDCDQEGLSIRTDKAAVSLCLHLQQKAERIQSGEEEMPSFDSNRQAEIESIRANIAYLQGCPDQSLVSRQLQELRKRLSEIEGGPTGAINGLPGNARQLLLLPEAADWNHWAAFLRDLDNLLYKLPRLVTSASVGYATPEDRPAARPPGAKGRRIAAEAGKPSVVAATIRA